MIKLNISPERAYILLSTVPNKRFIQSLGTHWTVSSDRYVDARSVCWLFCWAETGMGSNATANTVQALFGSILTISFLHFKQKVKLTWARKSRYSNDLDIVESELAGFLQ